MSVVARLVCLLVASGSLTMLIIGARLSPSAKGISTHEALGMPRCQFEYRTGIPCPSCGYTTSVTHFAHGQIAASLYVQPMGFVIALLASAAVWVGFYSAISGRPVYRLVSMLPLRGVFWALVIIAIGGWAWKIALHLSNRGGWA